MTAQDRARREANEARQNPALPSEGRVSPHGVWLGRGTPARPGVVWLKRPMPDSQWPPDQRLPRDDTFSWWVRSSCGHGVKQWAFYREADADQYEGIFRANPCHFTRCGHTMIENDGRGR